MIDITSEGKTEITVQPVELRDHFAALAMQAIITGSMTLNDPWYKRIYAWFHGTWPGGLTYGTPKADQVALEAYSQADAMMRQRAPLEWSTTKTTVLIVGSISWRSKQ